MNQPPNIVRPGADVPFDSERREGEVFARSARVQLSLASFLRIALWIALGNGIYVTAFNIESLIRYKREVDLLGMIFTFGGGILFGALQILLIALLMFPIYRWACEKKRGQVMRGKFSAIIPIDASNDSLNSDAQKPRAG